MVLPDNALLLHVGPHKTGTTAIQGALSNAREELAGHQIHYLGTRQSHALAARAALGRVSKTGLSNPPVSEWTALVDQAAAHSTERVVVSSEYFDDADDAEARRIVDQLGGERVHVVITLRPLLSILPSSWQQSLRIRQSNSYDKWLQSLFDTETGQTTAKAFWRHHRHDELVARWVSAVGVDRVTVLVVDEADPLFLLRGFESMLGLSDGLLKPAARSQNRSYTEPEAALLQRVNKEFDRRGWSAGSYTRFVRLGAATELKKRRPPVDEPRIATPRWAQELVAAVSQEIVQGIEKSGVEVVGDLAALIVKPVETGIEDDPSGEEQIPVDAAMRVALGAMVAGGAGILKEEHVNAAMLKQYPGISSASTRMLLGELRRRARRRIKRI